MPRSERESLTSLHLSDPQFGPNQPEAEGLTAADRQHDTLQARLLQDLEEITSKDRVPRPELVVVTGDLTEHAKPSQLAAFEAFAEALMGTLELPRERLVLVPGNHDVSWRGCEAYWLRIAAVHHNVLRNPVDDDANLRDAGDIEYLLADETNLVLHGHTHEGKLGTLRWSSRW